MKDEEVLELALLAGKALSLANAEAMRIEDTMLRILACSSYQKMEVLAQSSNIMVSLQDTLGVTMTRMIRLQGHTLNLENIHSVNEISRAICTDSLAYVEARTRLLHLVDQKKQRFTTSVVFGLWALGPAFVLVFKGSLVEVSVVMVLALLYVFLYGIAHRWNTLLFYLLASTMIAACSIFLQYVLAIYAIPIQLDIVVISAIMPMVPGIAITNSLRDIMNQDYVSGMAKLLESISQAGSIAFGIGIGYALGALL